MTDRQDIQFVDQLLDALDSQNQITIKKEDVNGKYKD